MKLPEYSSLLAFMAVLGGSVVVYAFMKFYDIWPRWQLYVTIIAAAGIASLWHYKSVSDASLIVQTVNAADLESVPFSVRSRLQDHGEKAKYVFVTYMGVAKFGVVLGFEGSRVRVRGTVGPGLTWNEQKMIPIMLDLCDNINDAQ